MIVSDEPDKYPDMSLFPRGVTTHDRKDLDLVQRELRDISGLTILIYDQTCAAEKRRRRKRGLFPRSAKARLHQRCGLRGLRRLLREVELRVGETPGNRTRPQTRHRSIELQQGFLLRRRLLSEFRDGPRWRPAQGLEIERVGARSVWRPSDAGRETALRTLQHANDRHWRHRRDHGGRAARHGGPPRGKGCSVLDFTGLAQKNGGVMTHVRIAPAPEDIAAVRIAAGGADLLLGFDIVGAASPVALARIEQGVTRAVINTSMTPTAAFVTDGNIDF